MSTHTQAGFPTGQAARLAGVVSYTPDSVVSRELRRNAAGTVTVFAFGAGQGLSTHSAPFDAMVTVLDGSGVVVIDGVEHTLAAGEFIIMPANVPHGVRAEENFKMLLVMLKG